MSTTTGWSAEMDRKLEALRRDPERYFMEARARARREDDLAGRVARAFRLRRPARSERPAR